MYVGYPSVQKPSTPPQSIPTQLITHIHQHNLAMQLSSLVPAPALTHSHRSSRSPHRPQTQTHHPTTHRSSCGPRRRRQSHSCRQNHCRRQNHSYLQSRWCRRRNRCRRRRRWPAGPVPVVTTARAANQIALPAALGTAPAERRGKHMLAAAAAPVWAGGAGSPSLSGCRMQVLGPTVVAATPAVLDPVQARSASLAASPPGPLPPAAPDPPPPRRAAAGCTRGRLRT